MPEPQSSTATALTANARHTIYTARNLDPAMKELVAGVLRAEARQARRDASVVEDTDTMTEDTIPFTAAGTDLYTMIHTARELYMLDLALGMVEDIVVTLGVALASQDITLVRDSRARIREALS